MSSFKVEVVRIEVLPHPNADRLDLIKIVGKAWQCIAGKGQFQSGDLAVYLPIDSVLPEPLVKELGIEKNYHKRLRSIKLRGSVSQGIVMPIKYPEDVMVEPLHEGDDVTKMLGITRYEVPIPVHMSGIQLPDEPNFFKYTDIENYKNFPNAFNPGESVWISEKIHGSSFRAAKINGQLFVGSHRMNLKESEGNLYWRAAKMLDLQNQLQDGEQVFAEIYGSGIQDLTYGKKQGEISVSVFDFMKDKIYLDRNRFINTLIERGWSDFIIPFIYQGKWDQEVIGMATGNSTICPGQIREGIVVKPLVERFSEPLQGRCVIKIINDEYLLRKDKNATENH